MGRTWQGMRLQNDTDTLVGGSNSHLAPPAFGVLEITYSPFMFSKAAAEVARPMPRLSSKRAITQLATTTRGGPGKHEMIFLDN